MRFHVKHNNNNIFIGFNANKSRFVFYTHGGQLKSVEAWAKFVKNEKLVVYDDFNNVISWEELMKFVDHLQYNSNAFWVNNFQMCKDGYNFSNNRTTIKLKGI